MAVLTPTVAIATAAQPATDIANAILSAGGNAFDAAAAAGFALAVCEPEASGLGGHAIAVALLAGGDVVVVDGDAVAPAAATRQSISRHDQHTGHLATTVPTMPAVLDALRSRHGRLSAHEVIMPSAELAAAGVTMTALHARHLRRVLRDAATPMPFLLDGPVRAGNAIVQPVLAATLRRLATHGVDDFFHGAIADAIAADMREHGGLVDNADLDRAARVVDRAPVTATWLGHRIVTAPPPAGGLQLLVTLALADMLLTEVGLPFAEALAEATSLTFTDAYRPRVDPDDRGALDAHLSRDHISEMTAAVLRGRFNRLPVRSRGGDGPGDTTHLCISDTDGNVVALTQSIQSSFGAKVANQRLGFFYNNYLTTLKRRGSVDVLRPRARPRSNAAPTIAILDGRPALALGAAGSRRITSSMVQTLVRVVRNGEALAAAVDAPRVHGLADRSVWIERPLADDRTAASLARNFARVRTFGAHDHRMGCVHAIAFDRDGLAHPVADPRRDGATFSEDRRDDG